VEVLKKETCPIMTKISNVAISQGDP